MPGTGFSSTVDGRRESALAAFFEQRYGCKLVHLGRFSEIDWIAVAYGGRPIALIEAKRRSNSSREYGDVFLSFRKWLGLLLAEQSFGIPAYFVAWFADGKVYSTPVNDVLTELLSIVRRHDIRASNDKEPAIRVPVASMKFEGLLEEPSVEDADTVVRNEPSSEPISTFVRTLSPELTVQKQLLASSLVGRGNPWPLFELETLGESSPIAWYASIGTALAAFFELLVLSSKFGEVQHVRIPKRRWDALMIAQSRCQGLGVKIVVQFLDCKKMLDLNRLRGIPDAVSGGEAPMRYPNQPPRVWWPELSASGHLDVLIPVDLFHDLPKVEKS